MGVLLWPGIVSSADLYWCPVCGGNTHHYEGHPHFSPEPVWTRSVQQAPSQPSREEREAYGLAMEIEKLCDRLSEGNYTEEQEIQLLNTTKQKLERLIGLKSSQPDGRPALKQVERGIEDWHRRAQVKANLERLRQARILNQRAVEAVNEQKVLAESEALRNRIEEIRRLDQDTRLIQIGAVAAVAGEVFAKAPGQDRHRKLTSGMSIYLYDEISTGENGRAQILFTDETVISLGYETEITIDRYVYDPFTKDGEISTAVNRGTFRFVSGSNARKRPAARKVKLPSGDAGIRGTDFLVSIQEDQSLTAAVFDGEIVYESDAGQSASVKAGQLVVISSTGEPGRVQSMEELARSVSKNLIIALASPRGLSPFMGIIKVALFSLGIVVMFGWVWSKNLREGKSMAASFVVGILMLTGAYLVSHFFGQ